MNKQTPAKDQKNDSSSDHLQGYKVSYAQNREDVIIKAFFPDVTNGFYVDIGANDPVDDSVTKLFYDLGWRGINVEPSPTLYKNLKSERPRDITVNVGASDKKGSLQFREYANHGLSTFSDAVKKSHEKSPSAKTSEHTDYSVDVLPTKAILQEHAKGVHIHFMKVDVEGYEYDVLHGNDWDVFRPELICIEANHIINDWHPLLKAAGYHEVFNDGLNEYFLAKESLFRKEHFDYAEAMLLDGVIINPGVATRIVREGKFRQQIDHNTATINKLELKIAELNVKYHNAQTELNQQKSIKKQIRMLYDTIDQKILHTLDKKSYSHKTNRVKNHASIVVDESDSVERLLGMAKVYDVATNFKLHSVRNPRKLHYRIAEKVYQTSRNMAFNGAKISYKTLKKLKGSK